MDKTYKRHSFTKLWIATAMFIFCCFATSAFAQEAVDADTFMTTTETITEVKTTPEIAETATASADRKSTRLNSSHGKLSRMPSSA